MPIPGCKYASAAAILRAHADAGTAPAHPVEVATLAQLMDQAAEMRATLDAMTGGRVIAFPADRVRRGAWTGEVRS